MAKSEEDLEQDIRDTLERLKAHIATAARKPKKVPFVYVDMTHNSILLLLESMLPEANKDMLADIARVLAHSAGTVAAAAAREARIDELSKCKRALERPPKGIDTGLMSISLIEYYLDGRLAQVKSALNNTPARKETNGKH